MLTGFTNAVRFASTHPPINMHNHQISVAAIGDVSDINCWSNIPYYFFQAGKNMGLFHHPWKLDLGQFNLPRYAWNFRQLLSNGSYGGYQYSSNFLDKAERSIDPRLFGTTVISFNQHFPRSSTVRKAGGTVYRYIDATLYDLIYEPAYDFNLPDNIKKEALDLETENYHLSEKIVVMAGWAKYALINYYKIPFEKIHIIMPGANLELPADYRPKSFFPGAGKDRPLVLGFIGKDWKRKGLELLRDIQLTLQERGYQVQIKIIGNAPPEIANAPDVMHLGFINKHNQVSDFVREVSSCDLGCLFSRSEALGISTLEFLRLGVPVAGYYHQGLKDTLYKEASLRFSFSDDLNTISDTFIKYIEDENLQMDLFDAAKLRSDDVTWERCVEEWKGLIDH